MYNGKWRIRREGSKGTRGGVREEHIIEEEATQIKTERRK